VGEIPHEQFSKIPCGSTLGPKSPIKDFSKNPLSRNRKNTAYKVQIRTIILSIKETSILRGLDCNVNFLAGTFTYGSAGDTYPQVWALPEG